MGSMSVALSELGYSIVAHTLYRSVSYYSLRVSAESFSFSLCLDAAALQAVSATKPPAGLPAGKKCSFMTTKNEVKVSAYFSYIGCFPASFACTFSQI